MDGGMILLPSDYPVWWILLCVAVGLLVAGFLYSRKQLAGEVLNPWLRLLLASFRALTVALLMFLILGPVLQLAIRKIEKPVLLLAYDYSASIAMQKDSATDQALVKESLDQISKTLGDDFDVKPLYFAEIVNTKPQKDFNGKASNIASVLTWADNQYEGANLGALVLFSDGLFNQGNHPLYQNRKVPSVLHTVALGDTTIQKDLLIKSVRTNSLAYMGNTFPIEVEMEARLLLGEKAQLRLEDENGALLTEQEVSVTDNRFRKTITLNVKAQNAGSNLFTIRILPLRGEVNQQNNVRTVSIDVIDGRNQVLIVAGAPHPDIGALKASIEQNERNEVNIRYLYEGLPELNKKISLLILHDLPGFRSQVTVWLDKAVDLGLPMWAICGAQTQGQWMASYFPGMGFQTRRNEGTEAFVRINSEFNLFKLSETFSSRMAKLPPLNTPFAVYAKQNESQVLLAQRIGNIQSGDPMLAFSGSEPRKAILYGEGIWRWRLHEFDRFGDQAATDELISSIIQYLSVKSDKRSFRAFALSPSFGETEKVIIGAELYNESFQEINDPEVKLEIRDAKGKAYLFSMTRNGKAYRSDIGFLPPGKYNYNASTFWNGKELKDQGSFIVKELALEGLETLADHRLLAELAAKNNGKLYHKTQLDLLVKDLQNQERFKAISYLESRYEELIDLKWLFWLLIFLFTLEWGIRKWLGSV